MRLVIMSLAPKYFWEDHKLKVLGCRRITTSSNRVGCSMGMADGLVLENPGHHDRSLPKHGAKAGTVRYQAAGFHMFSPLINRGQAIFSRELDYLAAKRG